MSRIQVVYASRHGGTAGIARRIGEVLREAGADVEVGDLATRPIADGFDAYVIGSGVYMGSWLKPALEYLERNQLTLAARPVWLFSSGPLPNPHVPPKSDPIEDALGPADGPGSGGRKRVTALADAIRVRQHRVFGGAYDPDAPAQNMAERVVKLIPAVKNVLPAGDFRPWPEIEAWAREIASEIVAPVAV
ncbi:MAG: flavodoxin domain-containing protein [Candidatus Limnocylindrales bacterium]